MKLWKRKPRNPTKSAGPTSDLYAIERFTAENVFRTKSGQLGVAYQLQGIDADCLSDSTMETYTNRLAAAFRTLDEDFRIYQYLVKHDGAAIGTEVSHPNPAVRQTLEARTEFLRAKNLYTIRCFLVILLEANQAGRTAEYLLSRASSFERSVTDLLGPRLLGKQEAFGLFRMLANLNQPMAESERLKYDNYVDYWMGSSAVACSWEGIAVDLKHVEVLTMREPPRNTFPHLLREFLRLDSNFVLTTEFKRESNEASIKVLNAAENHFHHVQTLKSWAAIVGQALSKIMGGGDGKQDIVPDASATKNVDELKETIVRISNEGDYMGLFSFTALLHSYDRVKLQGAVSDAIKIIGNQEGSLVRETYNALNAYRAMLPGSHAYNFRQIWMHSRNYVDMALVYAPRSGDAVNKHLNAPHLLTLETMSGTPACFNLHEDDLLGFLAVGLMGSGKSFTCNLFLDHSQKYNPFSFVLDIGGSYRETARKHGGAYLALAAHRKDFSINPFAMERTPESLDFLSSFVHVLLDTTGYKASPQDCRMIDKAVSTASRLSDLDLPEHLTEQLYNWTGQGRYAHLFDNAKDTLAVEDFQCFDFQGVSEKVLAPLFFYLFQRITEVVYNPKNLARYKQLIADEVWKFLTTPAARTYLVEAGKTWRKHNGGIGLITQSAYDLERVGLLDAINEICPTKIFFANPGSDMEFYRKTFHMNEKEIETFSRLVPKKQIFVKTPLRSSVLNVNVDPLAAACYANDPNSNLARISAQAEYGFEEGLKRLAKGA